MKILLICNYKPGVGGISGQVELLHRKLREEGHTADIFSTKGSFFWRLSIPPRLQEEAENYDVLHIHCCSGWGFLPAVLGVTVGRQLGKRVVLTYHGGGADTFFDQHSKLVRHYLMHTDQNIVLSGFLAQVFTKHRIPYTIIPNIIELDSSHYRERTTLKPHFICVRAHEPLYNIPCILQAFLQVQKQLPDATLTLVGNGSQHEALVQQASAMKLKNVTFTGRIDNSEIYRHLDQADIMLSAPTVDNMPVSLLEAMNAGLLVISSRVGGVPYMIEDGKTGLLFDSDNADQLAEQMLWAVGHPEHVQRMTTLAHKAVQQYSWSSIKDKILHSYNP